MLQPKSIAAVGFLAVVAVTAYLRVSREDPRDRPAAGAQDPQGPRPAIDPAAVDELVITGPGAAPTFTFQRAEGTHWRMVTPLADNADNQAIENVLQQLASARIDGHPAARNPASWPQLKVTNEQVVTATVRSAGSVLFTVKLGENGKYARLGDRNEVYRISGLSRSQLAREARQWRNRLVVKIDRTQVKSLSVAGAEGAVVRADRAPGRLANAGKGPPEPDVWTLAEGHAIVANDLDEAVPAAILDELEELTAEDFADDKRKDQIGLDPPRLVITATLRSGEQQIVHIGTIDGTAAHVGTPDSERVWTVPASKAAVFAREPLQWRDKTIVDLPTAEVARVDISYRGRRTVVAADGSGGWKLVTPSAPAADRVKLHNLAGAFLALSGKSIEAEPNRQASGLARPTATVRVTPVAGRPITLTIGNKVNGDRYVQTSTRTEVFLAPDYRISRLLVDADSLKAERAQPADPLPAGATSHR
jgi:hypothetical protein